MNGAGIEQQASLAANEIAAARTAQRVWSGVQIQQRVRVMRRMRLELARRASEFAAVMPAVLQRSTADTLIAEVLPLLDAARFIETNVAAALASRFLNDDGRSAWLGDIAVESYREPLGVVLIIAPANYPLFLAGVQCLQALAAGNAVLWKPAPGTRAVASLFAECWRRAAGSAAEALRLLDESNAAAAEAIRVGVDRVFLTGSSTTGEAVLRELAATHTSSVMELSGCDSVFILEGAEVARVVEALVFGMRFNGSATCMGPRRIFVTNTVADALIGLLLPALEWVEAPRLSSSAHQLLSELIGDAEAKGGVMLLGDLRSVLSFTPTLIDRARPEMRVMQTDISSPVLAVMRVADMDEALRADAHCPYALTAAIFGPENAARNLAGRINAGTVFINDLITPAADPRVPFGGRKRSGFGVTRGIEGLLAMTNVKTVLTQRSRSRRHYQPTTSTHDELFTSYIKFRHGGSIRARIAAIPRLIRAAITLGKRGS